jgi:polysaccharide deacetylase family protein (PEP-CTERM system associated)
MPLSLSNGPPVITVDVEDWPQSSWDRALPITQRAADNTHQILQILADAQVRATMFVLGKFAEAFPSVVREIRANGHEVACHGYAHEEIFKQSRVEFQADVARAKDLLEQILGEPVQGYRAPDFSLIPSAFWALDILAEAGFAYDSSIFPIRHPRYGNPNWPLHPVEVSLAHNRSILEFPIGTFACCGRNWPVGGGGYHRLLPGIVSRFMARRIMSQRPFVFYCHPYELDPAELSQVDFQVPWLVRLHQTWGRRQFKDRFWNFLSQMGGQPLVERLVTQSWPRYQLPAS